MEKLTEARKMFGFTNVWTQDEKILCKEDTIQSKFYLTNCMPEQLLGGVP